MGHLCVSDSILQHPYHASSLHVILDVLSRVQKQRAIPIWKGSTFETLICGIAFIMMTSYHCRSRSLLRGISSLQYRRCCKSTNGTPNVESNGGLYFLSYSWF